MAAAKEMEKTGAENIHWDLTDLYPAIGSKELVEDKAKVHNLAVEFKDQYRGKIQSLNADMFAEALKKYEQIIEILGKIGSYAHLIWSTNTESAEYGKILQEANELGSEINQELVFFDVEWLKLSDEKAERLINSEPLKKWKHYLRTSRRYKEHILTEEAEKVMSAKSVTGRAAWNRFFDETLGAARFELDGDSLTEQEVLSKLHSPDRELRKRAHHSLTSTFKKHARTLTFVFNTILADKFTNDKLRDYRHWLESRNLSNQIDDASVEALVEAVQKKYHVVQRYYKLKTKLLGLDKMYDYDRYAPLLESTKTISWQESKEIVLSAYGEFNPQMESIARKFFDEKWIDAAVKPGKRGGAYSAGTVTTVHPYVFMNFEGRLRDVQTLAHELGHGVHQYLSRKQGELQSSTPLTTAETASVFGEMLVFNRMMERLTDPKEKLALLISKIDDTIATVFRQVSMNRFENEIHHARREAGELSTDDFSNYWYKTQNELYGDAIDISEEYKLWWCYIPHFLHTPGYVYAYAFGELLVLALYDLYKKSDKKEFSEKYIELLEAGGSDWPQNIVGKMGVDITDASFWENGLQLFEDMISDAEKLSETL